MDWLLYVLLATAAYLLGSIPTGFLTGKLRGVDIRSVGSGNIGATNVFRVLGRPAGTMVLAVDAAKGALACGLLPLLASARTGAGGTEKRELLGIVCGLAAILGHNYTCWLRFKGGKGIATTAGVLAVWTPAVFGVCLGAWLLAFGLTRYVSVASLSAALALPLAAWWFEGSRNLVGIALVLSALAIYKHKANIQRLTQGTEHRWERKPAQTPEKPT